MEFLTQLLRASFVLFMGYCLVYLIQWLAGMVISVYRLSRFPETQERVRRVFTDDVIGDIPVSVLVPAFNEEACICETVDSLLEEDYPNLEIIVVDDGSKDATAAKLLSRYPLTPCPFAAEEGPLQTRPILAVYHCVIGRKRLTLICKAGGGKGDALNCGFNRSRSPYCVVVDADTQVRRGSLRIMVSRFLTDPDAVVCAGCVGTLLHSRERYRGLSPAHRLLVLFQRMEYYRTFYMHRLLFDELNANVIVSGAFAMFDRETVLAAGGYRTDTVGEDMELTVRLHAFCASQNRPYQIAYCPEARCDTQVPFRYRDYCHQRRRWHIGLTQSLGLHLYMIGRHCYGWVGVLSILLLLVYEMFSPFIELAGLCVFLLSFLLGLLNWQASLGILAVYLIIMLLSQSLLLHTLQVYGVEPISPGRHLLLMCAVSTECLIFHPINLVVKLVTFLTYKRYHTTWTHIHRHAEKAQNEH